MENSKENIYIFVSGLKGLNTVRLKSQTCFSLNAYALLDCGNISDTY